jgi:hypothetical protein
MGYRKGRYSSKLIALNNAGGSSVNYSQSVLLCAMPHALCGLSSSPIHTYSVYPGSISFINASIIH